MNGNGDDDDDDDDDDLMMAQLRARMEAMVTEGTTTSANGDNNEDPLLFAAMEMDPDEQDDNDEQAMDAFIAAEVAQAEAAQAEAVAEATSLIATSVPRAAVAIVADTTLLDPSQQLRRPWDDVVAAGPPAEHPPPFDRPQYSRGRRVTVVAYIPATECHEQLHNCLMRDFEREPVGSVGGVASPFSSSPSSSSGNYASCHRPSQLLAYYPIPHKRPIETIMGHVEICAVLERDVPCQDDTSRKSDDDDDDDDHLRSDGDDDEEEEEETDEEEGGVGGRGGGGGGFGCIGSSTKRKSRRRKQKQVDDSDDDDDEDDCIVFRLTNRFVAVKVNYWTRIVQMRDRHAEDPMKEIAAMQLVGNDLPGVMGCSEVLYVSGRDILDQAAAQEQQQQQQQQAGGPSVAAVAKRFFKRKYPPSDREEDNDTINVVMRYCQHGDLFDALQQPWRGISSSLSSLAAADQRPGFSEPQARFWFLQCMQGIRDLHAKGVCHRDLSPENVMIDDHGCLIIDLGMCLRVPYTRTITTSSAEPRTVVPLEPASKNSSSIVNGHQQPPLHKLLFMPQGACGKLPYMSPEIYRNRHAFDGAAVDVWCAGTILFCMLTGNRSYHRPHATDAQFYWMTHGLSQLLNDWNIVLSPQGLHLLRNMLQVDPRLRLTIDEVLNHPWFQLPHEPINVQQRISS